MVSASSDRANGLDPPKRGAFKARDLTNPSTSKMPKEACQGRKTALVTSAQSEARFSSSSPRDSSSDTRPANSKQRRLPSLHTVAHCGNCIDTFKHCLASHSTPWLIRTLSCTQLRSRQRILDTVDVSSRGKKSPTKPATLGEGNFRTSVAGDVRARTGRTANDTCVAGEQWPLTKRSRARVQSSSPAVIPTPSSARTSSAEQPEAVTAVSRSEARRAAAAADLARAVGSTTMREAAREMAGRRRGRRETSRYTLSRQLARPPTSARGRRRSRRRPPHARTNRLCATYVEKKETRRQQNVAPFTVDTQQGDAYLGYC